MLDIGAPRDLRGGSIFAAVKQHEIGSSTGLNKMRFDVAGDNGATMIGKHLPNVFQSLGLRQKIPLISRLSKGDTWCLKLRRLNTPVFEKRLRGDLPHAYDIETTGAVD